MKWIIVLAVLVAVVTCAPADVEVLRYENDNIGVDGYKFAWVEIKKQNFQIEIL